MPRDRYGHIRPDPLFPSAFYNGREWDMAATGLNISMPNRFAPYHNWLDSNHFEHSEWNWETFLLVNKDEQGVNSQ